MTNSNLTVDTAGRALGMALHKPTGRTVDVIGVREGFWTVRDQIPCGVAFSCRLDALTDVWPDTAAVDAIDELLTDEGHTAPWIYNMLVLFTGSPEWAQLLMRTWAELYC